MAMKKIGFVIVLAVMVLVSSCSKESITGSGSIGSRTIPVPAFTGVDAHYDIDASITYGDNPEVVLTGYENLLGALDVTVDNGILKLKFNSAYNQVRRSNVRASIRIPALAKAMIHGSGDVDIHGFNGGTSITFGIFGSGDIKVTGSSYNNAVLDIYGSGDISAQGLAAKEAQVNVYGSGNSSISVSEKLDARIFGSGDVNYWGNAAVQTSQNGSGRVIKR